MQRTIRAAKWLNTPPPPSEGGLYSPTQATRSRLWRAVQLTLYGGTIEWGEAVTDEQYYGKTGSNRSAGRRYRDKRAAPSPSGVA